MLVFISGLMVATAMVTMLMVSRAHDRAVEDVLQRYEAEIGRCTQELYGAHEIQFLNQGE